MNKKLIRLTESDLHRIVRESVNKVLKETANGQQFDRGEFEEDRASLLQIMRHLEAYRSENFTNVESPINDNGKTSKALNTCISCIDRAMSVIDRTSGFTDEYDFPIHWWADNYDEKGNLDNSPWHPGYDDQN